ncbi:hypothetical protein [Polymorphobacter sp.]|uniref:hypothetical protein n=1 Tax=Polymorphobacter sp. TaxID=1909290 RepID=UPI003F72D86A
MAPQSPLAIPQGDTRANQIAVWIVAAYLFAKMFYISKGGSAQPADAMLCALAFFIVPPKSMLELFKAEAALVALVVWIALVNLFWFMTTDDKSFLPSILYYVFNLLIVITFFGVRNRNPALFDRVICNAIILAVAVETAVVLYQRLSGVSALRTVGTFKNPNQLAYWGVVMLSLFVMLRRNRLRRSDLLVIGGGIFCEFASASRAGLAALFALLVVWLYFALETGRKRIIACLSAVALGALLTLSPAMEGGVAYGAGESAVGTRLNEDTEVSQFDERQYNRIIDFYEYTIFGAGEGYLSRFNADSEFKLEIHSSFGTMLFSYGIPGFALFMLLLFGVFRRLPISLGVYLVPSLLYGVTHQGLRFTLFWAFIGAAISIGRERKPATEARPIIRLHKQHQTRGPDHLRALASTRMSTPRSRPPARGAP